ncbi:MAG: hypothetical protein LC775_14060, partial [Acidobacteria bacterium]|nr:hypothetical protein [Acidobacteriota bacterium]
GMAVLSYTNVAKDELEAKICQRSVASGLLSTPHFVGTIDSFINQYVFLPFGSRRMGYTGGRPRLVGEPTWSMASFFRLEQEQADRFLQLGIL